MDIRIENRDVLCIMDEKLNSERIKDLVEQSKKILEGNEPFDSLCIDLANTKIIDSMGITFIVGLYKSIIGKSKKFRVENPSDDILELLRIIKLDDLFKIDKT